MACTKQDDHRAACTEAFNRLREVICAAREKRLRSPVHLMDSVEALDIISTAFRLLRDNKPADLSFLDRMREQRLRHRRALRKIIGGEPV